MISWIEASRASTLVDIWFIRSRIWEETSSNFASSCSSNVSTKAVNSCGLEISLGARFFAAGCFVVPFMLGPETFGVLLGIGEAGTFRGAGPIEDDHGVEW